MAQNLSHNALEAIAIAPEEMAKSSWRNCNNRVSLTDTKFGFIGLVSSSRMGLYPKERLLQSF